MLPVILSLETLHIFFDRLDHRYLKKQICNLLGCTSLPPDYYAVFKNITKYAMWDLDNILLLNGLKNTRKDMRELNAKDQVLTLEQFKKEKSLQVKPNEESFGIPQGSPISAILSNVYMLEFDKQLRVFCDDNKGLYMRYSDDFIVILPENCNSDLRQQVTWIQNLVATTAGLDLQEDKTQIFSYSLEQLENISSQYLKNSVKGKNVLHYLGFTFDGREVTIRDKTISKYYYRMYRKAKYIVKCKGYTKNGNRISNKNLYKLYSEKGAHNGKGNFLRYVQRASDVWGENEPISRSTKNHMKKIKRTLRNLSL